MKRPRKRNPIARALRSPHLRKQIIRNAKAYQRSGRAAQKECRDRT